MCLKLPTFKQKQKTSKNKKTHDLLHTHLKRYEILPINLMIQTHAHIQLRDFKVQATPDEKRKRIPRRAMFTDVNTTVSKLQTSQQGSFSNKPLAL